MSYENFAYYYDSLMDEQFYLDYYNFINEYADFKSILELGCGTGEIAIRLAKDNKEIYATDLSKDMLEVARLKALDANVNLMLGRVDMTDFKTDKAVDLILCLCDSINYVLSKKKVFQTFKNVYEFTLIVFIKWIIFLMVILKKKMQKTFILNGQLKKLL